MQNYYEVLTENGFKDFLTVSKKTVDVYATVHLSNGETVKCTVDHEFKTQDGFKTVQQLKQTDKIAPEYVEILYVDIINEPREVYDLVNVSDGNHYITNG